VEPDQDHAFDASVALEDFVRDSRQGPSDGLGVQDHPGFTALCRPALA
jgi:hypothetical protein